MNRIKQTLCLCSALLAVNIISGCSDDMGGGNDNGKEKVLDLIEIPTTPEIKLNNAESAIHSEMNSFGLKTLKEMIVKEGDENVVLSPFSAVSALSLYHNTRLHCLGNGINLNALIDYENLEDVNSTLNKLIRFLPDKSNGGDVLIGNSIWLPSNSVPEDLRTIAATGYYADMFNYKIDDYEWLKEMSAKWVDFKTNGEIKNFYLDSRLEVPAYVLNTIYFKGEWEEKFNPSDTYEGTFKGRTAEKRVQYMQAEFVGLSYMISDKWTAIALPFHGNYEMIFVLPSEGVSPAEVVDALSPDKRQEYKRAYQTMVVLPKFRIENKMMVDRYIPESIGVSVYQNAIVEIDENGAKAVAVTQPIEAPGFYNINFDRPFLFSIVNRVSGTSLMIGAVMNPAAGK